MVGARALGVVTTDWPTTLGNDAREYVLDSDGTSERMTAKVAERRAAADYDSLTGGGQSQR